MVPQFLPIWLSQIGTDSQVNLDSFIRLSSWICLEWDSVGSQRPNQHRLLHLQFERLRRHVHRLLATPSDRQHRRQHGRLPLVQPRQADPKIQQPSKHKALQNSLRHRPDLWCGRLGVRLDTVWPKKLTPVSNHSNTYRSHQESPWIFWGDFDLLQWVGPTLQQENFTGCEAILWQMSRIANQFQSGSVVWWA